MKGPSRRALLVVGLLGGACVSCRQDVEDESGRPLQIEGAIKGHNERDWTLVAAAPGAPGSWAPEDLAVRVSYATAEVTVAVWDVRPLPTGEPSMMFGTGASIKVPMELSEDLGARRLQTADGREIGAFHWPIRGAKPGADDRHWSIIHWVWSGAQTRWLRCEVLDQDEHRVVVDVIDPTYPMPGVRSSGVTEESVDIVLDEPLGSRPLIWRQTGAKIPIRN